MKENGKLETSKGFPYIGWLALTSEKAKEFKFGPMVPFMRDGGRTIRPTEKEG